MCCYRSIHTENQIRRVHQHEQRSERVGAFGKQLRQRTLLEMVQGQHAKSKSSMRDSQEQKHTETPPGRSELNCCGRLSSDAKQKDNKRQRHRQAHCHVGAACSVSKCDNNDEMKRGACAKGASEVSKPTRDSVRAGYTWNHVTGKECKKSAFMKRRREAIHQGTSLSQMR